MSANLWERQESLQSAHKPGSVPTRMLWRWHSFIQGTDRSVPPAADPKVWRLGQSRRVPGNSFLLLGLAPNGVYPAEPVTWPAGALLPHRFTLTSERTEVHLTSKFPSEAVCFLLHLPDPHGWWALPTIVSCGARTFLFFTQSEEANAWRTADANILTCVNSEVAWKARRSC